MALVRSKVIVVTSTASSWKSALLRNHNHNNSTTTVTKAASQVMSLEMTIPSPRFYSQSTTTTISSPILPTNINTNIKKRSLSTTTKNEELSDYAKQIQKMAETSHLKLTISDYSNELSDQLSKASGGGFNWRSYLPGYSSQEAVKQVNDSKVLLDAILTVLRSKGGGGPNVRDAGLEELNSLTKKDKLRIILETSKKNTAGTPTTLVKINEMISNFESMELVRRILTYRKENGLPLPKDEYQAKQMMTRDMKKVLTAREQREMQNKMKKAVRF